MIIGRIVGRVLVALALLFLVGGIALAITGGTFTGITGAVWYQQHADSLNLSQAVTQRYVLPYLWDPIAVTVLNWPLWVSTGAAVAVPGLVGYVLLKLSGQRT